MPSLFDSLGRFFKNPTEAPYLSDLLGWIGGVQRGALERWVPIALQGIACSDANNMQVRCANKATSLCEFCKRPTCLKHSFVGGNAEVICMRCIVEMGIQTGRIRPGANPPGQTQSAPPGPDPKEVHKELLKKHFKALGLRTNSTLETVKDRYKQLIRKNHPDRGGDEQRMKDINLAFEWLQKHHFKV